METVTEVTVADVEGTATTSARVAETVAHLDVEATARTYAVAAEIKKEETDMFVAIYRRKAEIEERREEMYTLFSKTADEVRGDDLAAIKAALDADNSADPAGKDYREASTALSLLLFLGDDAFRGALSAVFPGREDTTEAIIAFRDFVDTAKKRPAKGKEKSFFDQAVEVENNLGQWPMMARMVKQYTLSAMMQVKDFASVREMIRALCGEVLNWDAQTRKEVAELRNEFSGV